MNGRKVLAGSVLLILLMLSSGTIRLGSPGNSSGEVNFSTCVVNTGDEGDVAQVVVAINSGLKSFNPVSYSVTVDHRDVSSGWTAVASGNSVTFTANTRSNGNTEPNDLDKQDQLQFTWQAVLDGSGQAPSVFVQVGWVGGNGGEHDQGVGGNGGEHDQFPVSDTGSTVIDIGLGSFTGGTQSVQVSGSDPNDAATVCQSPSTISQPAPPITTSTTTVTTTVTCATCGGGNIGNNNNGGGGNSGSFSNSGAFGNSGPGSISASPISVNCAATCFLQIGQAAGGSDLVQCAISMLTGNNGGSNVCGNSNSWISAGNGAIVGSNFSAPVRTTTTTETFTTVTTITSTVQTSCMENDPAWSWSNWNGRCDSFGG